MRQTRTDILESEVTARVTATQLSLLGCSLYKEFSAERLSHACRVSGRMIESPSACRTLNEQSSVSARFNAALPCNFKVHQLSVADCDAVRLVARVNVGRVCMHDSNWHNRNHECDGNIKTQTSPLTLIIASILATDLRLQMPSLPGEIRTHRLGWLCTLNRQCSACL